MGERIGAKVVVAVVAVAAVQAAVGLHQMGNVWQYGHIGYNGAAYHQAARNTLRWGTVFPAQYVTGAEEPGPKDLYTHAPLALHLHTVASVALLGDKPEAVRLVPLLHGVGAAVALLLVLLAAHGWPTALLGSAIYLLLPVNTIYAHMSNHSTGFLLWSLLWIWSYLRWSGSAGVGPRGGDGAPFASGRWGVAFFATAIMAMQWDWPAYYVAFAIALHWGLGWLRRQRGGEASRTALRRGWLLLVGFCALVLASFGGFFLLAAWHAGGLQEIAGTFAARSGNVADAPGRLWSDVFRPLYGTPLLALSAGWLVGWGLRLRWRHAEARDLLPVAFAFAGVMHVLLFRRTALIHPYWPWPLHPFLAIAGARSLLAMAVGGRRLLERLARPPRRIAGAWPVAALLVAFGLFQVPFAIARFTEGRRVYGSVGYEGYDARFLQLRFAERLRAWTDVETRVVAHAAMEHRIHFPVTADRSVDPGGTELPRWAPGTDAVFVGPVAATVRSARVAMAARHPYREYGPYYMVDGRWEGSDVRIWRLQRMSPSPGWRYWVSPWHGPHRAVRDRQAEARMRREVRSLLTRRP
jgi:hypothetical protein